MLGNEPIGGAPIGGSNDVSEYAPWPEGYGLIEIKEITHVSRLRGAPHDKAAILMESIDGIKVCLVCDIPALGRAIMQIQGDPRLHPGHDRLSVVR